MASLAKASRPFTWFFGAISLINLFNDLDMIEIRSQVFGWLDSYRRLVETASDFLFGWAEVWIFSITTGEAHLLVVYAVVVRSFLFAAEAAGANDNRALTAWWVLLSGVAFAYLLPYTAIGSILALVGYALILSLVFTIGEWVGGPVEGDDMSGLVVIRFIAEMSGPVLVFVAVVILDRIVVQVV